MYLYSIVPGILFLRRSLRPRGIAGYSKLYTAQHMLESYPSLKAMYQPGDGNTEIFKLTKVKASICSFVSAPKEFSWE